MAIDTKEPSAIIKGDTAKWYKNLPDYLPADGWVLTYQVANSAARFTVTATDNGDGRHLATITAATSGALTVGEYRYQAQVAKAGERYTVVTGALSVKPEFDAAQETRTTVKQILDALQATIQGRATSDQLSYSIAGTAIVKMTPEQLVMMEDRYKRAYAEELEAERREVGRGSGRKIKVHFRAF